MKAESRKSGSRGGLATSLREAYLTPLQAWLVAFYILLEDARNELDREAWRAFIWISCDRIGEEAAKTVVVEALEATEKAA